MADLPNSIRFLNAFINIEEAMKNRIRSKSDQLYYSHKPFYQLVNECAKIEPLVRDIAIELKEYGDLRNAIVHERIDDQPIAEPHLKVVERLEKIGKLLLTPPTVADEFIGPVITCNPSDSLGEVALLMFQNAFSKLPVYEGSSYLGLLTAEAILHWVGYQLLDKDISLSPLSSLTITEILKFAEHREDCHFVAKDCPVFNVLTLFEEASHQGRRLQAVIITEDGHPNRIPLGIITVFELPRIYDMLNG